MKIVNFQSQSGSRVGVLDGDFVVDVLAAHQVSSVFSPENAVLLGNTISVIEHWHALRSGFEQAVKNSQLNGAGRLNSKDLLLEKVVTQ